MVSAGRADGATICSTTSPPSSDGSRNVLRDARHRRVAASDSRTWVGRTRHRRPSRRYRRDGDRDCDRRARLHRRPGVPSRRPAHDVTYQGVLHGRRRTGPRCLAWWESSVPRRARDVRGARPERARAVGHRYAPAVADHRAADGDVGARPRRVRGVARANPSTRIGSRTSRGSRRGRSPTPTRSPGREPPSDPLRVELTLPSGAAWTIGSRRRDESHHGSGR